MLRFFVRVTQRCGTPPGCCNVPTTTTDLSQNLLSARRPGQGKAGVVAELSAERFHVPVPAALYSAREPERERNLKKPDRRAIRKRARAQHLAADLIGSVVEDCFALRRVAREADEAMAILRANLHTYEEVVRERATLRAVDQNTLEVEAAHEIAAAISAALKPHDDFLTDQILPSGAASSRFAVAATNIDTTELKKRVAALRAINLKIILNAMRDNGAKS